MVDASWVLNYVNYYEVLLHIQSLFSQAFRGLVRVHEPLSDVRASKLRAFQTTDAGHFWQ